MVAQSAQAANGAAKRTRKSGDDLDAKVAFKNAKNEISKSIPAELHSLVVTDKAGKIGELNVRELPPAVIMQLAATDLRRRVKLMKATTKPILEQVAELTAAAKAGKLFVREAGAPRAGRSRDISLYHSALVLAVNAIAAKKNEKPLNQKQVAALQTQLEGYNADMWKKALIKWNKNPFFAAMLNQVKSERSQAALADASTDVQDLLSI